MRTRTLTLSTGRNSSRTRSFLVLLPVSAIRCSSSVSRDAMSCGSHAGAILDVVRAVRRQNGSISEPRYARSRFMRVSA